MNTTLYAFSTPHSSTACSETASNSGVWTRTARACHPRGSTRSDGVDPGRPDFGATVDTPLPDLDLDRQLILRVFAVAQQIAASRDKPTVNELFAAGVTALGVDSALFFNFVSHDSTLSACHVMVACDPGWAHKAVSAQPPEDHPWLSYATQHGEPAVAGTLHSPLAPAAWQRDAELAGFASTLLVPAHSGAGTPRISVLCLGATQAGFFESQQRSAIRFGARLLALELHAWWLARIRRELIVRSRLTEDDLVLLHHEGQGHSSKQIAAALGLSCAAVNSRFQRLNTKLGVINRRMALRVVSECGLVLS